MRLNLRCTPKEPSTFIADVFGLCTAIVMASLRFSLFIIGLGSVMFGIDYIFKLFIR